MQRQGALPGDRSGTMRRRVGGPTAAGWAAGILTTALVARSPLVLPAYRSPSLHLVLDTADTCIALLVAYLVHGRFLRSRRLQDLLLAQGLGLLALAGLGMSLVLGLLAGFTPGTLDVWLPIGLRAGAAVLIVLAACAGSRPVRGWARRGRLTPWAVVLLAFAVLWFLRDRLPPAVADEGGARAVRPLLAAHPMLFSAWAVAAVCFLAASVLFTRRAGEGHGTGPDELLRYLGPAFALAGFARLNYMFFPSLYTGWLYTGDLLRTASFVLLLVGAAREIRHYWAAQASAAVVEDRRRLARELHDGVVQEIAYIRSEAAALVGAAGARERVLASCDRATDEARAAVDALGRSGHEPLAVVLQRAARQVAERYDARLEVDLDHTVTVGPDAQHALVRITREAVSNAIRHGQVSCVRLRLRREGRGHRLEVSDAGRGFEPSTLPAATGFGLTSMSDRARGLGGSMNVRSAPGKGTTVEVTW